MHLGRVRKKTKFFHYSDDEDENSGNEERDEYQPGKKQKIKIPENFTFFIA